MVHYQMVSFLAAKACCGLSLETVHQLMESW